MPDRADPAIAAADLRVSLNENTGGCSAGALDAIRAVGARQIAMYPDYEEVTRACASRFGVPPDWLVLTNGLDDGIRTTVFASLHAGVESADAVIVEPAFEVYAVYAEAAGGRVVGVPPRRDFAFPEAEVRAALSSRTRLVFVTNPNNPTGQRVPRPAIRRILQDAPGAVMLLDEAYAEFAGETFLDELAQYPNLIIGRTFAKAYGLAGLRIGALIAAPQTLERIRRITPRFSVNAAAVAALPAALADRAHVQRYIRETALSREILYSACERLGIEFWPSAANFVLIRAGSRFASLVDGLKARGIRVNDRPCLPWRPDCIRITTGLIEHTRRIVAAMHEIVGATKSLNP